MQQARNVLAVEMRRSRQHRQPERRRLEQIVSADRHQAPADEGHIGRCIQRREFTHRVHQHDLRGAVRQLAAAAPREAHRAVAQQFRHRVEPVRMPRHQQQQRVGCSVRNCRVRREHLLLFARVRAAGNPYRPAAAQRGAQRAGPRP